MVNGFGGIFDDLGVVRVLPYTDDKIIQRTEQLPFCKGIFDPFKAPSKRHAQLMIAGFLSDEARKEAQKCSFTKQFMELTKEVQ